MGAPAELSPRQVGGAGVVAWAAREARKYGEDRFVAHAALPVRERKQSKLLAVFGVFDGNRGATVARLLQDKLVRYTLRQLRDGDGTCNGRATARALEGAYAQLNAEWLRRAGRFARLMGRQRGGSTATTLVIQSQPHSAGKYQVVTASVGDTRCVMYPNARGEAGWEQLSNDHTAERPMENMRVQMAGARVARETVDDPQGPLRVYPGGLSITRSVGNAEASESIIAVPDVSITAVPVEGARLVLASDGLWNALGNTCVGAVCKQHPSIAACVDSLMEAVLLRRGVHDDITIVVVDVHPEALDRVLASPATACACAKSWWEKQGWLAAKGYGGGYRKLRMRGEARGSESGDGVGVTRAFDACCAFGGFGADLTQRYVNGEVLDITAHDIVPPLVEPSRTDHTRSLLQESATRRVGTSEYLKADFTLGRMIGRGTYGVVFEASSARQHVPASKAKAGPTKVAVKTIYKDARRMRHMANELDTLVAVSGKHSSLPTVLATYEDSTELHIVTDLCDVPLLAYLEEANPSRQLDEGLLQQVVGQVLAGVATMHDHGIVHRDLKPDNLMVNRPHRSGAPCQVKIIDFGSACFSRGDDLTTWAGTLFYASPECSHNSYGRAADVWAVGVVMWVLLHGPPPVSEMLQHYRKLQLGDTGDGLPTGLSADCKHLLHSLLQPDAYKRLTAAQALGHPWLGGKISGQVARSPSPPPSGRGSYATSSCQQYEDATIAILQSELSSKALCHLYYRLLDHAAPGGMPSPEVLRAVVLADQVEDMLRELGAEAAEALRRMQELRMSVASDAARGLGVCLMAFQDVEQVRHWHTQVAARVADFSATASDTRLQRWRQASIACCILRPRAAGLQRECLVSEAPLSPSKPDSLTSHAVGTSESNRIVSAVEGEAEKAMARLMLRRQQSRISPVAAPLKSFRPSHELQMETEAT